MTTDASLPQVEPQRRALVSRVWVVQVDDRHGDLVAHHTQHYEQVGHQHGGEDFQEILDPQVDDHEPPE